MATRRVTMTSQEMNEINTRITTLEAQLQRSNGRVEELENGLGFIKKLITKKSRPKTIEKFAEAVEELVVSSINPPVTARLEAEALSQA